MYIQKDDRHDVSAAYLVGIKMLVSAALIVCVCRGD